MSPLRFPRLRLADSVSWILRAAIKGAAVRFERAPLESTEALAGFLRTRSSHLAQTALYGYLKARMGTRFRVMFEDEVFSASIRLAAARSFGSCLGDIAVYAAARVREDGGLDDREAAGLARHCFVLALGGGLAEMDDPEIGREALLRLDQRLAAIDWDEARGTAVAFAGSQRDLLRFAPVIDEFKELDAGIVANSVRFRWRDVREQLDRRLDAPAVRRDWRSRAAVPARRPEEAPG